MFDIEWSYKHDIYNLICLPIIISLNIFTLFNYNNYIINYFITFFLGYLIIDFGWIIMLPCSVSSPKIILFHHFITILGIGTLPFLHQNSQMIILLGSLVEVNTFVRIVRKSFRNNLFLNILFYFTWFGIRCILGPILLFLIGQNIFNNHKYKNLEYNLNILLCFVGFILNVLNIKWTIDLLDGGWKKLSDQNNKGL